MFLTVLSDILHFKALRKLEVELNGTALPGSADGIFEVEVDFRAVESAVPLVYGIFEMEFFERAAERRGRILPILVAAHTVSGRVESST